MKLAKVRWTPPPNLPDPEAHDRQLGAQQLEAGKGRVDRNEEPILDVDLEDDAANRRIIVRAQGEPAAFVPYERVCKAWFAPVGHLLIDASEALKNAFPKDAELPPIPPEQLETARAIVERGRASTCHVCGKPCADARGLSSHVRAKHPKEKA